MEAVVATEAEAPPKAKKKNPKAQPEVTRNLEIERERAKRLMQDIRALVVGNGEETAEDKETIADTFEGETTLDAALDAAFRSIDEDQIIVDGIKARQAELAARKDRAEKRIDLTRALIEQTLIEVGVPKIMLPIGTASLRSNKPKVIIDEEDKIPAVYQGVPLWKRPDPVVDNAALKTALLERFAKIEAARAEATGENGEVDEQKFAAAVVEIDKTHPEIPGAHAEPQGQSVQLRRS
jgi:hypothetical protein